MAHVVFELSLVYQPINILQSTHAATGILFLRALKPQLIAPISRTELYSRQLIH